MTRIFRAMGVLAATNPRDRERDIPNMTIPTLKVMGDLAQVADRQLDRPKAIKISLMSVTEARSARKLLNGHARMTIRMSIVTAVSAASDKTQFQTLSKVHQM
jgi:hypothetical protein